MQNIFKGVTELKFIYRKLTIIFAKNMPSSIPLKLRAELTVQFV